MMEDVFTSRRSTEVDVGGFPSHGVEKAEFGSGGVEGSEFDAGAKWTEAANDPASAKLNERIGAADGAIDDGLIEDFSGAGVLLRGKVLSPACGRRHQRFRLASDATAVPIGDGNVAAVAEAAESGNSMSNSILDAGGGHEVFDGVDSADWDCGLQGRESVHLLPEADGIAKFIFGDEAEPNMGFGENEGSAFFVDALGVTVEDGVTD